MSRNKPSEQKPGSFTHNPFHALKEFKLNPPAPKEKPKKKPPAPPARGEDDADLFLRAVGDAKRTGPGSAPHENARPSVPAKPRREEEERKLFLEAMGNRGAKFPDAAREEGGEGERQRSQSGRMRQLRRGTVRIGAELDLHGFLKEEALFRLGHFIASSFARGLQAVLVITGKGINSPEGPVLPGAVSKWLRESGRGMVAEFAPAPRDKGGSGAFVVFLKNRKHA